MAKRKRLTPARMLDVSASPAPSPGLTAGPRPPIADVAQDAAASAALREVAEELTAARDEGRLIQELPLDAIVPDHLVRDRLVISPEEQAALIASITERGQQTPIEVMALEDGKFGLISGYRRFRALQDIPEIDTILALVRRPAEASDAYRAMVDENEMRVDLSFYERARIVVKAAEAGVYPSERAALQNLFSHVPRARRSKINSFVALVGHFDDLLRFPAAISEKLGLDLTKAFEAQPAAVDLLREALEQAQVASAEEELYLLSAVLKEPRPHPAEAARAVPQPPAPSAEAPAAHDTHHQISPRLTVIWHGDDRITLKGPAVMDGGFAQKLNAYLKDTQ